MSYSIADEPAETPWTKYVVDPSAPLLAAMVCGAWLALPWFAFNAIAMGSPTQRREIGLCVLTAVVTAVLAVGVIALRERGAIESLTVLRFCFLGITAWKLGMAYVIQSMQERTFHVYEYYGGPVRSSGAALGAGYMLSGFVIGLIDDPVWEIIVSGGI